MKSHSVEIRLAHLYTHHLYAQDLPFQGLTPEQSSWVITRGRALYHWFKNHQFFHNCVSLSVMALLLAGDALLLLVFPRLLLGVHQTPAVSAILAASLITGALHGWIVYSIIVYTLHEGAAHQLIFPPKGPMTRRLNVLANNLGRLMSADPVDFARNHLSHHAHFGTAKDGEFLSFVLPRRYWLTLIPFAVFLHFSDFVVHRPVTYTRSYLLTTTLTLVYHGLVLYLVARRFGFLFAFLVVFLIAPHVAFLFDRLRQFSEHNLMPIERQNGTRSFGPGFWGLLIGGGPWGQPCHWTHHLIPTIPWYQQIILHLDLARQLTPVQRRQYLLQPVVGYPRLLWRLWTEPNRFQASLEGPHRTERLRPSDPSSR